MATTPRYGTGLLLRREPHDPARLLTTGLPAAPSVRKRLWTPGPLLDQGQTEMCAAYSFVQFLQSEPLTTIGAEDPPSLYHRAQARDGEPLPHDGTTLRAVLDTLREDGRIGEVRWGHSASAVARYVLDRGTVVFGTPWYNAFFTPDREGFINADRSEPTDHAYLCIGYDMDGAGPDAGVFTFVNSYGPSWGLAGRFKMHASLADRLFGEGGSACSPIEVMPA